jgi:membrane protein
LNLAAWIRRLVDPPWRFVRAWVHRIIEINGIDRAIVIGAQAFGALFPILILYAAVGPGQDTDFAATLIDRFDLDGSSASTVRQLFGAPDEIGSDASLLGALLLTVSALAFTRALQRIYERSWNLAPRGVRSSGWGLLWLAGFIVYLFILAPLDEAIDVPGWGLAISLALGCGLWLATPYILLARRVDWRRLVPTGLVTGASMTAFGAGSVIYLPTAIGSYADEFGTIGVAFALLSWLTGAAFVIMGTATLGAVIAEWRSSGGTVR